MESDLLSGACEYLAQYGVDQGQLALIAASIAAMLGLKVSYRVGAYAACYAGGLLARGFRYCFAGPEASPAFNAAMEALKDDAAVWSADDRTLACTGLEVWFEYDPAYCAAKYVSAYATGSETDLDGLMTGKEFASFVKQAKAKALEVIERDRVEANEDAAKMIERARQRAGVVGTQIDVKP